MHITPCNVFREIYVLVCIYLHVYHISFSLNATELQPFCFDFSLALILCLPSFSL